MIMNDVKRATLACYPFSLSFAPAESRITHVLPQLATGISKFYVM